MKTQLSMGAMIAILCGIGVGARAMSSTQYVQTAPQSVKAEQITSQPGQQLFPTVSSDRTVAYSQSYGSDWDVYVLRHAAPPVNLTADSAADDWQAEFSPDGKWLAFRSERAGGGIYIMDPDGRNLKRLTSAGFNPTWSPDGAEIAYSSAQVRRGSGIQSDPRNVERGQGHDRREAADLWSRRRRSAPMVTR